MYPDADVDAASDIESAALDEVPVISTIPVSIVVIPVMYPLSEFATLLLLMIQLFFQLLISF